MWFYRCMEYNEIQFIENEISSIYHRLKEGEELEIHIQTNQANFTTTFKGFYNIPDEGIIQIKTDKYYILGYQDIVDIIPEVFSDDL